MHIVRALARAILDFFFPFTDTEARVTAMTPADFMHSAARRHHDVIFKNPRVLSPFVYRDILTRTALHVGKYRGKKSVCRMLGAVLWDIYGEDISVHTIMHNASWCVVPVPMSARKKRKRGYNQSEEIVCGFLERADTRVCTYTPHIVQRAAHRESQTLTHSRAERQKNARNIFVVPDTAAVHGKNIVVIDDVTTSGATLFDVVRALRSAGARRILCITVAH